MVFGVFIEGWKILDGSGFEYYLLNDEGVWNGLKHSAMEDSLDLSKTTTASVTISKNRHIFLAQKLQELNRRIRHVRKILDNKDSLLYGSYVKIKVGPPLYLRDTQRKNWEKETNTTVNKCIVKYLLPEYKEKLDKYKEEITREIDENINEHNFKDIQRGMQIGINRANRKWNKREGTYDNNSIDFRKIGSHSENEIGT